MNTLQIFNMCKEIYRDYTGMQREPLKEDCLVLDVILRLYSSVTEIDWKEVKWLWMKYLETGNLYCSEAKNRGRIRRERE